MAEKTGLSVILKRYRVGTGLSQEALAERAGLSVRAISDLERGLHRTPHPATLDLLATALALLPQQRAMLLAAARPEVVGAIEGLEAPHVRPLPLPLTDLIGRERERAEARRLLNDEGRRLLTFTGPGGVGKTRLALALAHDANASFADGVVFVDLASARDESRFYGAIAEALGLRLQTPQPLPAQLSDYLRERRMLLILDNFEHLLSLAPFVAQMLERCPGVCVLATSRAPLRVRGEQSLALAPLPLASAVALFLERVNENRPTAVYSREVVEALCEQVDRLPLGIELAAAQTRLLAPAQALDLLTHRLTLLRGGARDLPVRQQAMEDTIAWSYDLLDGAQQRRFRALGVFVGGWTLEAAMAVCWPADEADVPTALVTIAALVDASLVQTEKTPEGDVRFRFLELTREFALARLAEAGEEETCRLRHARYFAEMADNISLFGPGGRPRFASPAQEIPNARAALEWAERANEATLGLRLAGFGRLLLVRGYFYEAVEWQERLLLVDTRARSHGDGAPLDLRAQRIHGLARTLLQLGELDRAEALANDGLQLAQESANDTVICAAAMTAGMIARAQGRLDAADTAFTLARDHAPLIDEEGVRYRLDSVMADVESDRNHLKGAARLLESALAGAEACGNRWDAARIAARLGMVDCKRQRYAAATRSFHKGLTLLRPFKTPGFTAWSLEGYAALLSAEGYYSEVARLCSAAEVMREGAHMPAPPTERAAVERLLATARRELGETAYRAAWDSGAALAADDAIAEALDLAEQRLSAKQPGEVRRIFAV